MSNVKLLVFAGSARKDSFSKKLASTAAQLATQAGAEVTIIDLADFPAAVYNGDDETAHGLPESMQKMKRLLASHDGFIIASPEYNGHVPPLLTNTFSWASRSKGDEKSSVAFTGKKAAIMASSPGGLGGIRVIPRLRDTLAELGVVVVPGFVTLPRAAQAFTDSGELQDESVKASVTSLIERLIAAC